MKTCMFLCFYVNFKHRVSMYLIPHYIIMVKGLLPFPAPSTGRGGYRAGVREHSALQGPTGPPHVLRQRGADRGHEQRLEEDSGGPHAGRPLPQGGALQRSNPPVRELWD